MREAGGTLIAVVGGGGFRTPRLLHGLIRHGQGLDLNDVVLYDRDRQRAEIMALIGQHLANRAGSPIRVRVADTLEDAVHGARFVSITVRPGGELGRVADERAAVAAGVLGQETVGPGGFFLALRTIATLRELLPQIRAANPTAWIVNFANPVGIVSEAARRLGEERFVGVCDTPHHLKQEIAHWLGAPPEALRVETVGLNHLGWFLAVRHQTVDVVPAMLEQFEAVREQVRPLSFFRPEEVRSMGALPTEYVYLYLHAREVEQRVRGASLRGEQVAARSQAFFERAFALAKTGAAPELFSLYTATLAARSNSYFQAETGTPVKRGLTAESILATESYERVAIDTMLGLTRPEGGDPVILNVPHEGAAGSVLPEDNVMELTCQVDADGVHPLPLTKPIPDPVRSWIETVKDYELKTVDAALKGDRESAVSALAVNPLVSDPGVARLLVEQRAKDLLAPPFSDWAS